MNKVNTSQSEYLVEKYQLLVYKIARRFCTNHTDYEDLVQAGLMGLFKATKRFDITKGVKFTTFATYYIIGAIKDELRKQCIHNQNLYTLSDNLNNNEGKYLNMEIYDFTNTERLLIELRLTKHLSQKEIAQKLKVSQSTVSRILKRIKTKIKT